MNVVEVIQLRLSADSSHTLAEIVRQSIDCVTDSNSVRVYCHSKIETDLLVHLHREVAEQAVGTSEVGERIAATLRGHGLVEHSVWIEQKPATVSR